MLAWLHTRPALRSRAGCTALEPGLRHEGVPARIRIVLGWALWLAVALLLPTDSHAQQCRSPGQSCGILGGSCCSGSTCLALICVANPPHLLG